MYISEIYLLNNDVEAAQWNTLHMVILQNTAWFGTYELLTTVQENRVRFFVASKRDLSGISSNVPGFILRDVESTDFAPTVIGRTRFIRFVTGGSLLDLLEKYRVKKSQNLTGLRLTTRKILPNFNPIHMSVYFSNAADQATVYKKRLLHFPLHLFEISFKGDTKYVKKDAPKYLNIEKSQYLLDPSPLNEVFEVDGFPYLSRKHYVNLGSYDFDKHSLIVGASGSGKSKLISLLIDRIVATNQSNSYRVIVVDPHDSLRNDLEHIESKRIINFADKGSELFPQVQDLQAATELTSQLLKTLLAEQTNPRLERVLRFSLYALFANKKMDFANLKRFITDLEYRTELLKTPNLPINVQQFFQTDFNEIRTQNYNEAIVPIVALVDEVSLMPSMETAKDPDSLIKTVTGQFLTIFSLRKSSSGERLVKTIAGTIIQNIFLLAQAGEFNRKILLIIDEVSVVQNPTLAAILAEARKFNVGLILTQQYLNQVEKGILDAIFSNVSNYYVFRVSEEDAQVLEKNIEMTIPDQLLHEAKAKGVDEHTLRARYMVEQDTRSVIVRLHANGQVHPALQARTVEASFDSAQTTAPAAEEVIPATNHTPQTMETQESTPPADDTPNDQEDAAAAIARAAQTRQQPVDSVEIPTTQEEVPAASTTPTDLPSVPLPTVPTAQEEQSETAPALDPPLDETRFEKEPVFVPAPEPAPAFTLKKIDPSKLESSKITPENPMALLTEINKLDKVSGVSQIEEDPPTVATTPEDIPPPSPVELIRYFSTNSEYEREKES